MTPFCFIFWSSVVLISRKYKKKWILFLFEKQTETLRSLPRDRIVDSAPSKVICCGVCLIWKHKSVFFAFSQARYAWWTESINNILVLFFHCGQTWWMFNIHYLIILEPLIIFGSAFGVDFSRIIRLFLILCGKSHNYWIKKWVKFNKIIK